MFNTSLRRSRLLVAFLGCGACHLALLLPLAAQVAPGDKVPTPEEAEREGLGLDSVPAPPVPGQTPHGTIEPSDRVPTVGEALQNPDLDTVDNDPTQLFTWICANQTSVIAVESKEINTWSAIANRQSSWQCRQEIPQIPDQSLSFSCEPSQNLGLITVFWLQGTGGPTQMKNWMTALANEHNLVCTANQSNPYWQ